MYVAAYIYYTHIAKKERTYLLASLKCIIHVIATISRKLDDIYTVVSSQHEKLRVQEVVTAQHTPTLKCYTLSLQTNTIIV